ncbi:biotin transporter BioY [Methanocalculus taiwanensis]|uniref:Biotin transporter BioY n=2 Tax=Methanocalculus taiwanensis TaxID=106207 RepID=A0ABD4TI85_9EURY|nr:biotin transporter BioY [Methanocalculus taiwanensis]MCQ1537653.1 biotin transporter BioY [Methanocalculus taiwanensis]
MYGNIEYARVLTKTAAFTALIAIGGWISITIPFLPLVPFTLQTLFLLLAAIVMKRYAVLPAALYLLLGICNFPVFHNGTAGIGVLLGPTGGYIIGFIPAAIIAGFFFEKSWKYSGITGVVAATIAIYTIGIAWLSVSTGMPVFAAIMIGAIPFIPGDILKSTAALMIGKRIP